MFQKYYSINDLENHLSEIIPTLHKNGMVMLCDFANEEQGITIANYFGNIMQTLDVASRITLFLVGQAGPLSFTFKDRLENKYKAQIGAEMKCSCSPQRNDHCIHTLYILLKIFKVAIDNPIIWQAAYVLFQTSLLVSIQSPPCGAHVQHSKISKKPLVSSFLVNICQENSKNNR